MSHPLAFIVVEDRQNKTLALCLESAKRAHEPLLVLSDTDAGPAYTRFCNSYVHLSSNTSEFEKICFRRYFLLSRYLAAHPDCQQFVLIDSDVLLFEGVGRHITRMVGKSDFSGSYIEPQDGWNPCQISPHVSYWTAVGLQRFVAFMLDTYATPSGRRKLREIADRFAARGERGGVSDMTLLYMWARSSHNMDPINRVNDGGVIDHNINSRHNLLADEFCVRGGAKALSFEHGHPCMVGTAGEHPKAMALHFQGSAKVAMSHALHGRMRTVALVTQALQMARRLKNSAHRVTTRWRRASEAGRLADAAAK